MTQEPLYKVRPIRDLKDMLEQSVKLFGDRNAFLIKAPDQSYKGIKYSEFKSDVVAFGTALTDLGLKNEFIAVIGENRYEWCVTYLAVVNGTGVIVPLDKELPPAEIENLLIRSEAKAIVFSGKYENIMRRLHTTLSSVKYYINMDASEDEQYYLSYSRLVQKGKELIASGVRTFLDATVDPEAMNMLLLLRAPQILQKVSCFPIRTSAPI